MRALIRRARASRAAKLAADVAELIEFAKERQLEYDIERCARDNRSRAGHPGVGMPAWIKLNEFGRILRDAFPGGIPYLVGTAAYGKSDWRDVDVRMMLNDTEWNRLLGPDEVECQGMRYLGRTGAYALAFSELGRQMTGLPIDFQLQRQERANALYGKSARIPLGANVEKPIRPHPWIG